MITVAVRQEGWIGRAFQDRFPAAPEDRFGGKPTPRNPVASQDRVDCYAGLMTFPLKGLVQGNTVVLDELVPPLEGKRVLVVLEPVDEPELIGAPQNLEAWRHWLTSGPRGPSRTRASPSFRDRARRHSLVSVASLDKRRPVLVLGRPDVLPSLSQIPVIPLSCPPFARRLSMSLGSRKRPRNDNSPTERLFQTSPS